MVVIGLGQDGNYYLIDAMVAKEIHKYHLQCKLGASNLTNNMVMQVYGGPRIGRMAYFSVLYDLPTKANTHTYK
jgi:hypothetical protein